MTKIFSFIVSAIGLVFGFTGAAVAAIPAAVTTAFTDLATDIATLEGLVWTVVILVTFAVVLYRLFKRFVSRV